MGLRKTLMEEELMSTRTWIRNPTKALLVLLVPAMLALPAIARAEECTGVIVQPGDDIQAAIDAQPRYAKFCIKAGTYYLTKSLRPRQGQIFMGEPGTVLDGSMATTAIDGFTNSAVSVTVRGMEIRNFTVGIQAASGWVIEYNNIHDNAREGARLLHANLFRGNHTHHNRLGGVNGYGSNIRVINNEIDHNQIDTSRCSQKFVWADNLRFRLNYVHDNRCPAVWADISTYRPLIARNVVENNIGPGIDCEISYKCIIRYNVVRNNSAGIIVSSTPDAEVYENVVENNSSYSIRITQQGTTEGVRTDHPSQWGPHITKNNLVKDNTVVLSEGFVGITKYGNVGDHVYSPEANNRFVDNNFTVQSTQNHFKYWARYRSWNDWQSYGHDLTGTFQVQAP
jgi:Right handed beta helix region